MRQHAKGYIRFLMRIACGLTLVLLLLSLTACARSPGPAVLPVQCLHPEIDPYTHSGLTHAVREYSEALNLCNTLNGYPLED